MTDDVKRLRDRARRSHEMAVNQSQIDDAALFDRAADALALLDAARGAGPLAIARSDRTSAVTVASATGPARDVAHALIRTALALLEADRAD
jgi:hypothetical protein